MIKCIVVDDENGAVEILERYIRKTPGLELTGSFRDSIEALKYIAEHDADLVFLDIDMPNLNGMQFSNLIGGRDIDVIFCTAYSQYAVQSYEKNAVDYLLKPIAYERFRKAVEKVLRTREKPQRPDQTENELLKQTGDKIFLKSGAKLFQVDTREILYLEKQGHYILFVTESEELLSRMNMTEILTVLTGKNFARVHRSYVVAMDKIDTIEKHAVKIKGKRIPIGDSFREEFFQRIRFAGN